MKKFIVGFIIFVLSIILSHAQETKNLSGAVTYCSEFSFVKNPAKSYIKDYSMDITFDKDYVTIKDGGITREYHIIKKEGNLYYLLSPSGLLYRMRLKKNCLILDRDKHKQIFFF